MDLSIDKNIPQSTGDPSSHDCELKTEGSSVDVRGNAMNPSAMDMSVKEEKMQASDEPSDNSEVKKEDSVMENSEEQMSTSAVDLSVKEESQLSNYETQVKKEDSVMENSEEQMSTSAVDLSVKEESQLSNYETQSATDNKVDTSMVEMTIEPKIVLNPAVYACDLCDKAFVHQHNLKSHMLFHTGECAYKCDVCEKFFVHSSKLESHMRTHTGERPFKCEICGASFGHTSNLSKHVLIHAGEKPHKCPVCDKGFTQSGDVIKHMRTHTGERPYSCHECGATFTQSSHLNMHIRTHTGMKLHKCTFCDRQFNWSNDLKRHLCTHTGERPYECEVCGKRFIQPSNLKTHMKVHEKERLNIKAPDRPYECEICFKKFMHSSSLKRHARAHAADFAAPVTSNGESEPEPKPQPNNSNELLDQKLSDFYQDSYRGLYECKVCKAQFIKSSHLHSHMQVHRDGDKSVAADDASGSQGKVVEGRSMSEKGRPKKDRRGMQGDNLLDEIGRNIEAQNLDASSLSVNLIIDQVVKKHTSMEKLQEYCNIWGSENPQQASSSDSGKLIEEKSLNLNDGASYMEYGIVDGGKELVTGDVNDGVKRMIQESSEKGNIEAVENKVSSEVEKSCEGLGLMYPENVDRKSHDHGNGIVGNEQEGE